MGEGIVQSTPAGCQVAVWVSIIVQLGASGRFCYEVVVTAVRNCGILAELGFRLGPPAGEALVR